MNNSKNEKKDGDDEGTIITAKHWPIDRSEAAPCTTPTTPSSSKHRDTNYQSNPFLPFASMLCLSRQEAM